MKKRFVYTGRRKNEISFPLGGIGTGSIGFGGNGRLIDWEIRNRPDKGSSNGFSHLAIKAEKNGKVVDARILHGDLHPPYTGSFAKSVLNEFGSGPPRDYLSGMPHFKKAQFVGEFPIARLRLADEQFPGKVQVMAFNPFIPMNEDDSSIPAAFFEVSVFNNTDNALDYTVNLCVKNQAPPGTGINTLWSEPPYNTVELGAMLTPDNVDSYGDISCGTDSKEFSCQEYLFRGSWFESLTRYWQEFCTVGPWKNRTYTVPNRVESSGLGKEDYCVIAAHVHALPGERAKVRFVLGWNYPFRYNYWDPGCDCATNPKEADCVHQTWRNFYSSLFTDSKEVVKYCLKNWDRLYAQTKLFKNALFSSSLPPEVLDAVSANLSILKSPTVLRLEDGTLYGFEGCNCESGCCDGSCSHVWNYEYAVPYLFPRLRRGFRDIDFAYNLGRDGGMTFRLQLPIGRSRMSFRPCVDGQFGGVFQAYREWILSGDSSWLAGHWESIKKMISYAWSDENPDRWDYDKDGVLEGCQHHTLDMELFGPNAWLTGFYLLALRAGTEMAEFLGDHSTAEEYRALFSKGKSWVENNLFNGEYYQQDLDLTDKSVLTAFSEGVGWDTYRGGRSKKNNYWDEESGTIRYQLGEGCIIEQVVAQWYADLGGLGDIFKSDQVKKALRSIYDNNFIRNMRSWANPCRVYALNDEAALVICTYPRSKPAVPIPYSEEAMNGFEYQAACQMIQKGMVSEGIEIVKAVRDRYDGEKRNPWNEFECGSNYVRSLAAYAFIPVFSGFMYDGRYKSIRFAPIETTWSHPYRTFWSANSGWGTLSIFTDSIVFEVLHGALSVLRFSCSTGNGYSVCAATVAKQSVEYQHEDDWILFQQELVMEEGQALKLTLTKT